MIFGIRITLPIFPAVDLSRVEATPALLVGLSLVVLGAWLKRGAEAESGRLRAALGEEVPDAALGPGTPIVDVSRSRVSAVAKPRDGGP